MRRESGGDGGSGDTGTSGDRRRTKDEESPGSRRFSVGFVQWTDTHCRNSGTILSSEIDRPPPLGYTKSSVV